ncbi:mitoguardin-like isoform X2, partial [Paramuricea clavata]
MNGIIESPFFKVFATTNSLLLGAGALYLVSFGRESSLQTTDHEAMFGEAKFQVSTGRKHGCLDERHKYTENHGLEEFAQHLEEWNKSLSELEIFLANNVSRTRNKDKAEGLDEVDAMDVAGLHNSGLIFEKVDRTLNNVVSKIDQLRQMLKTKHSHSDFSFDELSLLREDDSDTDSFLSAEGDVEDEVNQSVSKIDHAQQKAFHVAGIHRDKPFYLMALEHYFKHGIKCRKKRAKLVGCSSEVEFLAKVHCIREACKMAFAKEDVQTKFERNATELLRFLITTAGKDHHECEKRWKALLEFCKKPENFKIFERELIKKGVPYITFYDLVLDFVVMDAFVDLENPPYSIQAAVQNAWLPTYIQQTGLETAVWGVLKAKMQMLEEPAGFLMHFYHLSEILTPVLAWGFLGSDEALKKACSVFK